MAEAAKRNSMHDIPTNSSFPETLHFAEKTDFDEAVGRDFILHANQVTRKGERFLVGLSHGISPSGPYAWILNHYDRLRYPELIRYTFVHSPLKRQRDSQGVLDAKGFLLELRRRELITKDNILGTTLNRESLEAYAVDMEVKLNAYLKKYTKEGIDYVFLASDPTGRVGAITPNSKTFGEERIGMVVHDREQKEMTITPYFLLKSKRIAFLATKADKRRSLAMLYASWGTANESPSFLRFMPDVHKRMTVYIDDKALTWPQIEFVRETPYGPSEIRIDTANIFDENAVEKRPVVLLIHGFLGLNTFDGIMSTIPADKYIAAAMHYGTIPNDLPPAEYSQHVVQNIDAAVGYFGALGHPVYIFDHSMANCYFLMIDRDFKQLPGIRQYLRGRIGGSPFFGEEAQHALIGFLDNVILPSKQNFIEGMVFRTARNIVPFDSKKQVRKRSIWMTGWLLNRSSKNLDRVWAPIKDRVLHLMSNMDSLPELSRVPITRALKRLPAKVFAIQVHSALKDSRVFDEQQGIRMVENHNIPVMILKSERDPVASYVSRLYKDCGVEVLDVTNPNEKNVFREHLYHMVHPLTTGKLIDQFIQKAEATRAAARASTSNS